MNIKTAYSTCAASLRNACIMDTDCIPEGSVVIFTVVSGAAIVTLGAASGHGWQSTAEEKRQAAQDPPLACSVPGTWSLVRDTCTAERVVA